MSVGLLIVTCVGLKAYTRVSDEHNASIFRDEDGSYPQVNTVTTQMTNNNNSYFVHYCLHKQLSIPEVHPNKMNI
jgi:hypothetical protein